MNVAEHLAEHAILGMDFRFPAEGNTFIKITSTPSIQFWVDGVMLQEVKT